MSSDVNETMAVGKKLVELCNQGKHLEAINTLYSDEVVSVEVCDMPGSPATRKGIDEIREKNQWWFENHEVHSGSSTGPYPHGDRFIVIGKADITVKSGEMAGQRMQIEEAALYTVKDGKIVKEEFFYDMEG